MGAAGSRPPPAKLARCCTMPSTLSCGCPHTHAGVSRGRCKQTEPRRAHIRHHLRVVDHDIQAAHGVVPPAAALQVHRLKFGGDLRRGKPPVASVKHSTGGWPLGLEMSPGAGTACCDWSSTHAHLRGLGAGGNRGLVPPLRLACHGAADVAGTHGRALWPMAQRGDVRTGRWRPRPWAQCMTRHS